MMPKQFMTVLDLLQKKRKELVAIQEAGVEGEVVGSLEDIALDM